MRILLTLCSILLFIFLAIWGYCSYLKVPLNYFVISQSHLQGKKILKSGDYWFFPEKIYPQWLSLKFIPNEIQESGSVTITLPYADLLKNFGDFYLKINFKFNFKWYSNDLNKLYTETSDSIIQKTKYIISSKIQENVILLVNQKNPTSINFLKNHLSNLLSDKHSKVDIFITYSPNLKNYSTLKQQIEDSIKDSNLTQKLIQDKIQILEENQKMKVRKKQLEKGLEAAIQIAKKIKQADVNIATTLDILNYIIPIKKVSIQEK